MQSNHKLGTRQIAVTHMRPIWEKSAAAIFVTIAVLASGTAMACSCRAPDLALSIADADIVLVVKVVAFNPLDRVTVLPREVFKGSASKTFTIRIGQSDCDYFLPPIHPKAGDEFLLFVRKSEGRLTASRCLTSGPAAEKISELRSLRRQFPSRAQPGAALDQKFQMAPARSGPFHEPSRPSTAATGSHQASPACPQRHFDA